MGESPRIAVPEYKRSTEDGKEVVVYLLDVALQGQSWRLEKRYSELEKLHARLQEQHGAMPAFPAKTLFAVKKPEELEARRQGLAAYFAELCLRADVALSPLLAEFAGAAGRGAEMLVLVGEKESPCLGYRDFLFAERSGCLASVKCDLNPVSRADSYFTNYRMPWDSREKELVFSVGSLELCALRDAAELSLPPLFQASFNTQPICLAYDAARELFAVGCDDGSVKLFRAEGRRAPKFECVFDEKVHDRRVMRVLLAERQRLFFSVGADGCVRTSDAENKLAGCACAVGRPLCNALLLDGGAKLLASDAQGGLHLFDAIPSPVRRVAGLETGGGELRGLALYRAGAATQVFACSLEDGGVHCVAVEGLRGEPALAKLYSLGGDGNPRALECVSPLHLLAVGYRSGMVRLFDLLGARAPVFSRRIHAKELTQIAYLPALGLLATAGKDRRLCFFRVELARAAAAEPPARAEGKAGSARKEGEGSDEECLAGWNS